MKKKLICLPALLALFCNSNMVEAGSSLLVSINSQSIVGNNNSSDPSLSKGGASVAFESDAHNLVLQDGNNAKDVFLKTGGKLVSRISVNSLGQEGLNTRPGVNWWDANNFADSENPSISSDGKLVVFQSKASNLDLLTADSNGVDVESDIFVRDVAKKKTYRLSGVMDGADGVITPGTLDTKGNPITKTDAPWKILNEANDISSNPVIAGTAKTGFVAFQSEATNLSTLSTTLNRKHIYFIDLKTKKIELISATHDINGNPLVEAGADSINPAISPDGRFVAFQSKATNLLNSAITPDSTSRTDIFVYDRNTFTMYQLSGILGTVSPTNGYSVSAESNGDSENASMTGGGKTKSYLIAFESKATNLDSIPGGDAGTDRDIFVAEFSAINPKDPTSLCEIKSVKRISAPIDLITGNVLEEASDQNDATAASNTSPVISGTPAAYVVAFKSDADNLLYDPLDLYWNEDSNQTADIYVFNSKTKIFSRANVDNGGQQGNRDANNPAISSDGKAIGFDTDDEYLVPEVFGNDGESTQIYLRKP